MAAANAADPKTERKTEAERPAVSLCTGRGRAGPSRAEWGWGGVGHALGFPYFALRLGPGYKDRPRGLFGPSGAE